MLGKGKRQIYIKHKMSSCFKNMPFKKLTPAQPVDHRHPAFTVYSWRHCVPILNILVSQIYF